MNRYIYGVWRGLPAREEIGMGVRESYMTDERRENGYWQRLGPGYDTEFKPWPDQVALVNEGDAWAENHRR
jgi:hypothetical protein